MPEPKVTLVNNVPMHFSVGAYIKRNGKILLIDRAKPPYGWAGPAGHIDEDGGIEEDPQKVLFREVYEEVGLHVVSHKLRFSEKLDWNICRRGVSVHYWYLFECTVLGVLRPNKKETKDARWLTPEEIKNLPIEPAWQYWLKKLKIL